MWTLEGYNVIIAQSIANIGIGLFKLVTLNDAISILYGLLVLVQPPYEVKCVQRSAVLLASFRASWESNATSPTIANALANAYCFVSCVT